MPKDQLPFSVINQLKNFVPLQNDLFFLEENENTLLLLKAKKSLPSFYFAIQQVLVGNKVKVTIRPADKGRVEDHTLDIRMDQIGVYLNSWIENIKLYENTPSFWDDPILKQHTDYYFEYFEFVDDKDSKTALKPEQIHWLDEHLEKIEVHLENSTSESNKEEVEQIIKLTKELRNNLGRKTKNWIAKRLFKIYGFITKQSAKLSKEIINDEIKEGVRAIIRQVPQLIDKASDLIS